MASELRAVHVVPNIADEASGHATSVVRLCQALIGAGETVRLAVLDFGPHSRPAFVDAFPVGRGPRRLGCSPAMRRWLASTARSGRADVIHNHSLWMMPNVYPGWAARTTKSRLVISPRGTLSERALRVSAHVKRIFWPLVQRPALIGAACFHATCESEVADIRRAGFRQPVCVIPNGIDVPPLERPSPGETRYLLFLGRIHPIKGIDLLLHAWHAVASRFPQWQLIVAGPDNRGYLPRMQSLATALKLPRVFFCGPLYGEAKLRTYREAELFVLPSHSENFGMTVVEALAAGTPAIVSRGAPWRGLEEHRAGWWIERGVDPLIASLEEALSQPPEALRARGSRGRDWMLRDFDWDRVGTMMDRTYRWLISGGEAPAWIRLD